MKEVETMKTSNGLSIAGFVVSLGSLFLGLWGLTGLVGVALSAVGRSQAFSGFAGFIPPEDFGKIWGWGLTWRDWGDYNSIKGKDGESTAGAARSESRGRWEPAARCAGTWLRRLCARARVSVRRGVPLQAQPMVVGAEAREGG